MNFPVIFPDIPIEIHWRVLPEISTGIVGNFFSVFFSEIIQVISEISSNIPSKIGDFFRIL